MLERIQKGNLERTKTRRQNNQKLSNINILMITLIIFYLTFIALNFFGIYEVINLFNREI